MLTSGSLDTHIDGGVLDPQILPVDGNSGRGLEGLVTYIYQQKFGHPQQVFLRSTPILLVVRRV